MTIPHLRTAGKALVIGLLFAVYAFPLYWVVTMSFKPEAEWNPTGKVIWFPKNPTLDNYTGILGLRVPEPSLFLEQPTESALDPIANSLIAAVGGTSTGATS